MDKIKTLEEGQEKAPPVMDIKKPEPEKKDGPQMGGKSPADAQSPAVVMPMAERREGDAEQARKMDAMQRQVGNKRLARMLTGQGQADEHAE